MKTIRIGLAMLAAALIAFSCSKTELNRPRLPDGELSTGYNSNSVTNGICGEPVVYTLADCNGLKYGTLSVSNDKTNLFVTFTVTNADYKLQKSSLVLGTLAHVTAATNDVAWPKLPKGPNPADYSNIFKPLVSSYTYTIPLANYADCFDISAYAKLIKRDPVTNKPVDVQYLILQSNTKTGSKKWSTYVEYCKQDCPPPQCGQLTTYTQGGYGNDQGNGAGTSYMIANFDAAFPSGVTVGCASGFTMVMTNSGAIQTYLPSSSTPAVLTQNYTDNGPNTVLGGQLLTLALSVGFDNYDPDFGAGTQHLADMVIVSGDFAGKTVAQFLAIANDVFGGCSSAYTAAQINVTATAINENYDNGTVDNGYLTCPPPPECGQLTTYTQGGYGNDQGNGAGTSYMIANFDAAFPGGVTVGCAGGFTMVMTNSGAIQIYLPSSSTPAVLTQNYTDNGPNTILGGQLLTLALSVGFDNHDPNFGAGTQHLADMVIASGDFAGKTVGEFLAIANDVFGGCSSAYTAAQINVAATAINENYDNGTVDNGYLTCPNN